ncbi:MAG: nucleoside-diphosphate kinase [Candidatus Nanohaloarchaeota archaeon]|nr:nucleoside-diphosphate kinase [Candidatus Nanohaloarchaeota archaeon]
MERTLVILKPDAIQRGIVGEILSRFEKRGFKIIGLKMMQVSRELAEKHYLEHQGKPFYDELVEFITAGPVVVFVVEGNNAISNVRKMVGATNPEEAAPGTIRHDYGLHIGKNIIHASDSRESAEREIDLFFNIDELVDYKRIDEDWIY